MLHSVLRRLTAFLLAAATVSSLALGASALPLEDETEAGQTADLLTESGALTQETSPAGEAEETPEETPETPPEGEAPEEPEELPQEPDGETPEDPETPQLPEEGEEQQPQTPDVPEEELEELPQEPEWLPEEPEAEEPLEEQPEEPSIAPIELPQESRYVLEVSQTKQLTLTYDDRYDVQDLAQGYVVLEIETDQVTSYQVDRGSKTGKRDTDVLVLEEGSETKTVAAGVGTATVLLVDSAQLEEAQMALEQAEETGEPVNQIEVQVDLTEDLEDTEETPPDQELPQEGDLEQQPDPVPEPQVETISVIQVDVTVKPAKLTMMFLGGQSNMEGLCAFRAANQRVNSILCPEGEVYSTFLPSSSGVGSHVARIPMSSYTSDPNQVVAGSLTGTTSLDGSPLVYPIDSLTDPARGKTGMDSGLAYEWNRLTGDKVWVVNAAVSGSTIKDWVSGKSAYDKALSTYRGAIKTMEAEVSAGHYTAGNRLFFWLQGEADRYMSAENYLSYFQTMKNGMEKGCSIQYFGLIIPRSSLEEHNNEQDNYMTGPRIAQYFMARSTDAQYSKVYLVSNVNDQWLTNQGVRNYFRQAYPSGRLDYPLRSTATISSIPTYVDDVHGDNHYAQVGHNENGITAARNLYYIVKNKRPTASASISWRAKSGRELSQVLYMSQGGSSVLVPVVEPVYNSKGVQVKGSNTSLSYSEQTGVLTARSRGTGTVQATANGKQVGKLTIQADTLGTPQLGKIANQSGKVLLTWEKVENATGYYVYRKTTGQNWTKIATVTSGSYTDTKVTNGVKYTYTVVAYQGSKRSDYDRTGLSTSYVDPVNITVSGQAGAVKVTWGRNSKADSYVVYRRTGNGSWQALKTVGSSTNAYTDTTAVNGVSYEYAVVPKLNSSQGTYTPVSWLGLENPQLVSALCVANGVRISWKTASEAVGYRVYRKQPGGTWAQIAQTTGVNYIDSEVSSAQTYIYTVRAYSGRVLSGYDSVGKTVTYLKPTQARVSGLAGKVQVTWTAISGAENYKIYRREKNGSWQSLKTVGNVLRYTDSTARNGIVYEYAVVGLRNGSQSAYTPVTWLGLETPQLSSAQGTEGGIQVSWKQVKNATGYLLYRRNKGASAWTRIAQINQGTTCTYLDTTGKSGVTYEYTLKATRGSFQSDYDRAGCPGIFLSSPTGVNLRNSRTGVALSWDAIPGATQYLVYRKNDQGGWVRQAIVSAPNYTDSDANQSGKTYVYTVRAGANGSLSGYQRAGFSILYLATPKIQTLTNTTNGIQLAWSRVNGATSYVVYRSNGTGGWTRLATVTGTSFTDTGAQAGAYNTYTLRAAKGNLNSDYDHTGVRLYRLRTPELTRAAGVNGGIQVTWKAVSGAESYVVYRKSGTSGWVRMAQGTSTSWRDTSAQAGTTYTYTVRAVRGNVMSDYNRTGIPGRRT